MNPIDRTVPAHLVDLLVLAAGRDIDQVSLVRETLDGDPIGWDLWVVPLDEPAVMVNHQIGRPTTATSSSDASGSVVTLDEVETWVRTFPSTPVTVPENIIRDAAVNDWDLQIDRLHPSRENRARSGLAESVSLRACTPAEGTSDRTDVGLVIWEKGQSDVAVIDGDVVNPEELTALLSTRAAHSVPTLYFDEDAGAFV